MRILIHHTTSEIIFNIFDMTVYIDKSNGEIYRKCADYMDELELDKVFMFLCMIIFFGDNKRTKRIYQLGRYNDGEKIFANEIVGSYYEYILSNLDENDLSYKNNEYYKEVELLDEQPF